MTKHTLAVQRVVSSKPKRDKNMYVKPILSNLSYNYATFCLSRTYPWQTPLLLEG